MTETNFANFKYKIQLMDFFVVNQINLYLINRESAFRVEMYFFVLLCKFIIVSFVCYKNIKGEEKMILCQDVG